VSWPDRPRAAQGASTLKSVTRGAIRRRSARSLGLFETPEQGKESTKIDAAWIKDEKLDTIIPNEPKITSGRVVATSERTLVAV
jgi:hypothetical protein